LSLPREVDILVAGFGAAGASAALAACEAGASVAVVEKTSAGGGNCVHSGGFLLEVDGPRAVDHLDALCFGKTDRAVLQAFADGLPEVAGFLASLGGATAPVDVAAFGGMLPSWPHFPGAGHVRYRQFTPADGDRPGIGLWRVPGVATASVGPRRDARARVLDRAGQQIPGLLAAGAAGSIWGHLTEHGGGLTDAIVFGRLAGAEAAGA
jgi:glycine/D-amino acid oxidase-like deaminating enzyme